MNKIRNASVSSAQYTESENTKFATIRSAMQSMHVWDKDNRGQSPSVNTKQSSQSNEDIGNGKNISKIAAAAFEFTRSLLMVRQYGTSLHADEEFESCPMQPICECTWYTKDYQPNSQDHDSTDIGEASLRIETTEKSGNCHEVFEIARFLNFTFLCIRHRKALSLKEAIGYNEAAHSLLQDFASIANLAYRSIFNDCLQREWFKRVIIWTQLHGPRSDMYWLVHRAIS